jgi:hypothetical protein
MRNKLHFPLIGNCPEESAGNESGSEEGVPSAYSSFDCFDGIAVMSRGGHDVGFLVSHDFLLGPDQVASRWVGENGHSMGAIRQ